MPRTSAEDSQPCCERACGWQSALSHARKSLASGTRNSRGSWLQRKRRRKAEDWPGEGSSMASRVCRLSAPVGGMQGGASEEEGRGEWGAFLGDGGGVEVLLLVGASGKFRC